MRNVYRNPNKKHVLLFILLGAAILLSYSLVFEPSSLLDVLVSMGFFAILYYYDKKINMSIGAFLLVFVSILLNPLGLFWLYSHFVLFGFIGYDKVVHFVSSFAVAYALLQSYKEKKTVLRCSLVILIVLGLGAIVEINEFIGSRYFGIERGGIFAIGDYLPEVKSDLQRYDTYFDLIFNLAGSLTSVFFAILQNCCKRTRIQRNK